MMPTYHIIYNSKATLAKRYPANALQTLLRQHNINFVWHDTTFDQHAYYLAAHFARFLDASQEHVIVSAGGLGTLHHVINGLMSQQTSHRLPIAVLPLSHHPALNHFTLAPDPLTVIQQWHTANPHAQSVLRLQGDLPKYQTQYVLDTCDIGLNALYHSTLPRKWRFLRPLRLLTYCNALGQLQVFRATIHARDQYHQYNQTSALTLTNTPHTLNLTLAHHLSKAQLFWQFITKRNWRFAQNTTHQLSEAKLHTYSIQNASVDGEFLGNGSFAFDVTRITYPFWLREAAQTTNQNKQAERINH
jgi:hypothetical protein